MKVIRALFFLFTFSYGLQAQVETVAVSFEFNSTSINRAIVSQFNDPNFIFQHFTGDFEFSPGQIVAYDIQLSRPTVSISGSSVNIDLQFDVSIPSLGLSYQLQVSPSITIDEASIMGSEVVAFIDDLESAINNYQSIPSSVRVLLIGLYNTYKPQIYASKLYNEVLEELNSNEFLAQRALKVTDFGASINIENDKLVLKVLAELTASETQFITSILRNDNGNAESFYIDSKIKCKVKRIKIVDEVGNPKYYYEWPDTLMPTLQKLSPTYVWYGATINIGDINVGSTEILIWHVYFKTDATFYYNEYKEFPNHYASPIKRINY